MKRQICSALLVSLLWGGYFVRAEVVTWPLPELVGLVGRYPGSDVVSVDLGAAFSEIHSVKIQCSGSISSGLGCGDGIERPVFPYYQIPGVIEFFVEHPASDSCVTTVGPYSDGFSVEQSFDCPGGTDWSILLDGQAELVFHVRSKLVVVGGVTLLHPAATIYEASLIIDGVPAGASPVMHEVEQAFLLAGSTYTIAWTDPAGDCQGSYFLDYSIDDGATWTAIEDSAVSGGCAYDWTVPAVNSAECRIRILDADSPWLSDTTDVLFAIYECQGPVAGDLDGNCYVEFNDFGLFAAGWGEGLLGPEELLAWAQSWLACGNPFDPVCTGQPE
ncbi:MAG: hypothetical protein IH624_12235 [Phycisphaerae bacterium]|nr:hypothetical protein [Phycisphaerae bacterium]